MSCHKLSAILLTMACLAVFTGLLTQQGQLTGLRAEAQQLRTGAAEAGASPVAIVAADPTPTDAAPPELLQLRSQVSQLRAELRDLAGVQEENQRLSQAITAANTNAVQGLPPGYISRRAAQQVGLATPEDTLQTFLWALQHQDITNLLQTLSPAARQSLKQQFENESAEQFFKRADLLPGLAIVGRRESGDGSLELKLQMVPELPPMEIKFQQLDGQWRMDLPR